MSFKEKKKNIIFVEGWFQRYFISIKQENMFVRSAILYFFHRRKAYSTSFKTEGIQFARIYFDVDIPIVICIIGSLFTRDVLVKGHFEGKD